MRSFILASTFLTVLVQCGYSVAENNYPTPPPSYALPKKYPVPPAYPTKPAYASPQLADYAQKPSYSTGALQASAATAIVNEESDFLNDESSTEDDTTSTNSENRKRAKARTAHNRQFQRRALQPIRRFQQKKQ